MIQSTATLKAEPKFDVRYGFQLENGDFEYEREFDVPLSKLQYQIRTDEARYNEFPCSEEGFQFVDAVFEVNTDKIIKNQDVLKM